MKIFAGHDGGSGCCFYRIELPLRELAKHDGFEVTFRSAGDEEGNVPVTLRDMQGYDVIIGQRFNHHRGLQVWRRARTPFSRLVYETDDDVFTISPENWQAYHLYQQGEIRDAVIHTAETADLVTVTTEPLAAVMREFNPNVAVLPNCIPSWLPGMERTRRQRPAIGWQGGASHGADVGLVTKPVRQFLTRFPGWDLRLAGTDYRPTFRTDRAVFTPWIPVYSDTRGYFESLDFDIGLAPLCDTPFNMSKSFVKVLEYAALGIPSVASATGPYPGFIRHGENGFLARYEHEWLKYLSELAGDAGLRKTMGDAARESARAWTIDRGWRQWEAAYSSLFASARVS